MNMKNMIILLKATYDFKRHTRKCLKQGTGSEAHILAKYYEDYFKGLKDREITSAQLNILSKQLEAKQLQPLYSDDIQNLLSSVSKFTDALKSVLR